MQMEELSTVVAPSSDFWYGVAAGVAVGLVIGLCCL